MLHKFTFTILLAALGLGVSNTANAQAFEKGATYLNLGLGGSHLYQINSGGWANSINGGVSVQMEWGIHEYVGLGFTAGLTGGRYGWGYGYGYYGGPGYGPGPGYGGYGILSVPVGIIANFHFYQLIEDKTSKDIHGDKVDVYAGLNVGSGIGFVPTPNRVNALFFAGPQVGAKYYVTPNLGLGLEVGYGKTFINGGLTFKL